MKNIEIPLNSEKTRSYKLLEKLPATLSWTLLALPFILALISPILAAFFILAYILTWFMRAVALNMRVIQGYGNMKSHEKAQWKSLIADVENGQVATKKPPKWHIQNIERLEHQPGKIKPNQAIHVAIIAVYNETIDVVGPTVESVVASDFDMKKVILFFAFEERGGERVEKMCNGLVKKHGKKFLYAEAVKHPDGLPNEVKGKGGNITYAAKVLKKRLEKLKIDPERVQVTTLDSDNRPHKNYFNALTYTFALVPEPKYISFQPIPIFTNNIWDVPMLMRVVATGNSFWNIIQSLRPHMIRNFASHSQSMKALIDTNFWSVRTIVEDGHQFWRTYFRYDGKHEVYPIFVPVYQDAVLADGYRKTLKAQFIQIRRWAYGCSDIPYVITKGYLTKNNIPKWDKWTKTGRLIESHVSWATAPLLILFAAFVPILFNPDDIASNQLPGTVSTIMRISTIGLIITLYLGLRALPIRPPKYKRIKYIPMVIQWALLPIVTIVYNATAALVSQTRLFFGWYLDKFDVTEKAVKK